MRDRAKAANRPRRTAQDTRYGRRVCIGTLGPQRRPLQRLNGGEEFVPALRCRTATYAIQQMALLHDKDLDQCIGRVTGSSAGYLTKTTSGRSIRRCAKTEAQ